MRERDSDKDPDYEDAGCKNGEDQGVGKVVIHGQFDVVLPQSKGSSDTHQRCEDVWQSRVKQFSYIHK